MSHPPIHTVSIRLCEQCMGGEWPCETPNCALNMYADKSEFDTSPALRDFYVDPATGKDTRTNDNEPKETP